MFIVTPGTKLQCLFLHPVPSYYVYCYTRYQATMFIFTPGTKLRCLLLHPVPSYNVYCYTRYQATMFIFTPGTKLQCLLLHPVPSYNVYFYTRYQATMFTVTPGTKLRCLLLWPVPSFKYCVAKSDVSKSLSLNHIICKTSLRSALWERVIFKLCSNSITSLYMQQYCACMSNFKSYSRNRVSYL